MFSGGTFLETESGHILEKGRLLVCACSPIGAVVGKGALIGTCVLTQEGRLLVCVSLLNRGAYWYMRAYSIGAPIGLCVLTQ